MGFWDPRGPDPLPPFLRELEKRLNSLESDTSANNNKNRINMVETELKSFIREDKAVERIKAVEAKIVELQKSKPLKEIETRLSSLKKDIATASEDRFKKLETELSSFKKISTAEERILDLEAEVAKLRIASQLGENPGGASSDLGALLRNNPGFHRD